VILSVIPDHSPMQYRAIISHWPWKYWGLKHILAGDIIWGNF